MRNPHPADAWAARQIARAACFTVCRFRGAGRYDTRRFATLAEARADAAGDRRAIIYAVTSEGITVHVENGSRDDGLNVRYRPDLSESHPWTVCFRYEPQRGFATREQAEMDIAMRRARRIAQITEEGAR
jgi:hypothetical protein